jgi:hypothetical protein
MLQLKHSTAIRAPKVQHSTAISAMGTNVSSFQMKQETAESKNDLRKRKRATVVVNNGMTQNLPYADATYLSGKAQLLLVNLIIHHRLQNTQKHLTTS